MNLPSIVALVATMSAPMQVVAPPAPPPPTVPPPPVVMVDQPARYQPPQQMLVGWTMGEARCGDTAVGVTIAHRVTPSVAMSYVSPNAGVEPVTLTFRIDDAGRPLGVARVGSRYVADSSDLAPSLVASRFASGRPQRDCRIDYTPWRSTLADAPLAEVRRYAIAPTFRPDAAVFARTYPAGSDCFNPAPGVRLRGFPRFDDLPRQPGELGWSMAQFDIDRAGKPIHVTTVAGTGDLALDQASRRAVAASRFEPGARHGCVYPYYVKPGTLSPPPQVPMASLRPAEATCPLETAWDREPRLVYPANYDRRNIEGWAIVAFDVAPWGATGNIRVLAAEPAADFGEAAVGIIGAAAKAKSASGYSGCVERVVYRIGELGRADDNASGAAGGSVPVLPVH